MAATFLPLLCPPQIAQTTRSPNPVRRPKRSREEYQPQAGPQDELSYLGVRPKPVDAGDGENKSVPFIRVPFIRFIALALARTVCHRQRSQIFRRKQVS